MTIYSYVIQRANGTRFIVRATKPPVLLPDEKLLGVADAVERPRGYREKAQNVARRTDERWRNGL